MTSAEAVAGASSGGKGRSENRDLDVDACVHALPRGPGFVLRLEAGQLVAASALTPSDDVITVHGGPAHMRRF